MRAPLAVREETKSRDALMRQRAKACNFVRLVSLPIPHTRLLCTTAHYLLLQKTTEYYRKALQSSLQSLSVPPVPIIVSHCRSTWILVDSIACIFPCEAHQIVIPADSTFFEVVNVFHELFQSDHLFHQFHSSFSQPFLLIECTRDRIWRITGSSCTRWSELRRLIGMVCRFNHRVEAL